MSDTTIVLITLFAYKAVLLSVGVWASRRVKTEGDFFLAGQGLGAWTAGLSYAASTSSAWVLLGFTGTVFAKGAVALWLIPGIFGGYLMTWLVMGPRLNAETTDKGHITVIDFLTQDIGPNWKRLIGITCAAMIVFCFVFYIAAQFQAAGNAITEVFGLSSAEAVILGAIIIVIYCLLGGFWAASITDALQAVVMMTACILVPTAAVIAAGGFGEITANLHANEPASYFSFTGGVAGMLGIGAAMGLFGTGLGALGQPQLLNRIMAVKSQSERRKGAMITIGWGVIIYSGLVLLAFAARSVQLETGEESLFFAAAKAYLWPVLAGIVIAAVLSAVMSTVDSLLLAAASAVSHDLGVHYKNPGRALLVGRLAMVVVAILSVFLTIFATDKIFDRVLFSWVALGAAFGPAILTRCLGWTVKDPFILAAIVIAFFIAVPSANAEFIGQSLIGWTDLPKGFTEKADAIEKWGSWAAGLTILWLGRK
ncbi:MAG: sodium/proline symporter [Hellea sp.]|nr:sodium/proline symporter [Hellea sp.]